MNRLIISIGMVLFLVFGLTACHKKANPQGPDTSSTANKTEATANNTTTPKPEAKPVASRPTTVAKPTPAIAQPSTTPAAGKAQGQDLSAKVAAMPKTTIEFTNGTEFDWGQINEGDVKEHTFTFKNTGNAPLQIDRAKGSCGCTVPDYPKTPIAPGATGEIHVKFNSKGKKGQQKKSVTIWANTTPENSMLYVKAAVTPAATPAGNGNTTPNTGGH
ncbi:MAG: DUF1573 domain-containing protein [Chitinophagales bacterium]|jgi:outer membrane biosynthesis protein TonB|nr:DUF1573 domain-containing protein [Chitinophagales bacterium]MCC7056887.1 DUF1573 domain-containing protein [Chitinophagales bacterium]MDA0198747.1 DUF1573 domain-containing protein [Bacteroidota bacterium]